MATINAMFKNTNPAEALTLQEFLSAGEKVNIKYGTFCLYGKSDIKNLIKPIYNILDDYIEELEDYVTEVIVEDDNVDKYRYNPKRLAYDLYQSTDLYFIILYLNNLNGVKEFTLNSKKIKIIKPNAIDQVLSLIYDNEYRNIKTFNTISLEK